MFKKNKNTGFAIALAWPETFCKQPGSWYDGITRSLRININNYYRAGHAALVLVDKQAQKCHYFDFGRYHTPFKHGRVRSAETDHDLQIKTIPIISGDGKELINYTEILNELQSNFACHGEGKLHASYCEIDFYAAYAKAKNMQNSGPIPYGPFRYKGSNCSRFVNTAILAGKPKWNYTIRLKYVIPLTPTPLNNVNSLKNKSTIAQKMLYKPFYPNTKLSEMQINSTLQPPKRHPNIPESAQWLSGEGAGSWFDLEFNNTTLSVIRYSPNGEVECLGLFENHDNIIINHHYPYKITYPSSCKEVTLQFRNKILKFTRTLIASESLHTDKKRYVSHTNTSLSSA